MSIKIKHYLPKTLLGRSIMIVIVPVMLLQIFTVYMFFDRHWSKMTSRLAFAVAGEVAVFADTIEQNPHDEKTIAFIQQLSSRSLDLLVGFEPGARLEHAPGQTTYLKQLVIDTLSDALQAQVRRPYTVRMIEDNEKVEIRVQLNDGVLSVISLQRRLYSSSSYIFLMWMIGSSLMLTVIAAIFMRNQIRPIRKLAIVADRFGRGLDIENYKPEGAREVRQAARAFIEMRDRLRRQIDQRTAMLAGVSHDLRTPLTRLKLGLSMVPETPDIQGLRDDVATMERMLNAYLDFARGEGAERPAITNISALLHSLIDQETRAGADIKAQIDPSLYMTVRPLAIERALGNVLSNARKYGKAVHLTAEQDDDSLIVTVEDDGPGIPPEKYEEVFRPFFRLDPARTIDGGGVGLGLSIALDLVQAHGGHITLGPSLALGGLKVEIVLPR